MANTVYVKTLSVDYGGTIYLRASGNTTDDANGNWKFEVDENGDFCIYYYKINQWILREKWEKII